MPLALLMGRGGRPMKIKRIKKIWKAWLIIGILALFAACGGGGTSVDSSTSSAQRGGGAIISSTVSSPKEMKVGDLMALSIDEGGVMDFAGVDSSAEFILAVGSHSTNSGYSSMLLRDEVALTVADESSAINKGMVKLEKDLQANEILSTWLRAAEVELSEEMESENHNSMSKGMFSISKGTVGQSRSFRVLNSLTSLSSYAEVSAKLVYSGSHVELYIDTRSTGVLDSEQIDTLGREYDRSASFEFDLYGDSSDVDEDGKVIVLMTPQINYLGSLAGGIITGFFYAADLYARTSSNPVSNNSEIVYALVPDPEGEYGVSISVEFAMKNLLPAVVPHELQHLISYNQHVLERSASPEDSWLNEALSHLTEDLVGYNLENPSRYALFLADSSGTKVVTNSSPNLEERGASYLFLRFMYEQSSDGNAFLKRLVQSESRGVSNLESAFQGPEDFDEFSEFMTRWVVALAVTDRGVTQDARYIYKARTNHSITGNLMGACMICPATDNRETELTGPFMLSYNGSTSARVDSSATKFYSITSMPSEITFSVSSGSNNFAILIRVR